MFIGHFAVGLASKELAPRASLGPLMAAPLLLDLLWPVFLLLGWERVRIEPGATAFNPLVLEHYPWSHSLLLALVWAALFAGLYWSLTRYRAGALAIAVGVLSHWGLDLIVHRPDLPLYPGDSPLLGLGLWNHVRATIVLESVMFVSAAWVYARVTRAADGAGRYGFWAFVGVLGLLYVATAMNPTPPGVTALAVGGLVAWVFPFWAGWFDRHRDVLRRPPSVVS